MSQSQSKKASFSLRIIIFHSGTRCDVSIRCTTLEHRRAQLYTVCRGTFPAARAALGLQPAAAAVSLGNPSVRCRDGMGDIARLGSRAAATGAIHRAAPCSKAPPGRFTPGTDEQCSGRRLASRRVCCARFLSPSAVCTPANDDTRTRPSRCPRLASTRPCTMRAAINCMPRDISGGESSFGTAASCGCRVVG